MQAKFYTKEVLAKMEKEFDKRLIESADEIQDSAKAVTPVRTGKLRESIERSGPSNGSITVGTDVHYGKYVELGTRKQSPQYFLTRGFRNAQSKVVAIFSRMIQ